MIADEEIVRNEWKAITPEEVRQYVYTGMK